MPGWAASCSRPPAGHCCEQGAVFRSDAASPKLCAGSVRLRPRQPRSRLDGAGAEGVMSTTVFVLESVLGPVLALAATPGAAAGTDGSLPTHRRHSRAAPSARSHRLISRAGSPASRAHALFEKHLSCVNLEARMTAARKVLRGQRSGFGSGGSGGRGAEGPGGLPGMRR
jgi:hypothetical protein